MFDFTLIKGTREVHLAATTPKAKAWIDVNIPTSGGGEKLYAFTMKPDLRLLTELDRAGLTVEELPKSDFKPIPCSQCRKKAVVVFTESQAAAETDGTTHVCHPFWGGCGCGFQMANQIKVGPAGVVFQGRGAVEVYRLTAMISALGLEEKGMTFGVSWLAAAKRTTGLKTDDRTVQIERIKVLLEEAKAQVHIVQEAKQTA